MTKSHSCETIKSVTIETTAQHTTKWRHLPRKEPIKTNTARFIVLLLAGLSSAHAQPVTNLHLSSIAGPPQEVRVSSRDPSALSNVWIGRFQFAADDPTIMGYGSLIFEVDAHSRRGGTNSWVGNIRIVADGRPGDVWINGSGTYCDGRLVSVNCTARPWLYDQQYIIAAGSAEYFDVFADLGPGFSEGGSIETACMSDTARDFDNIPFGEAICDGTATSFVEIRGERRFEPWHHRRFGEEREKKR